MEQVLVIGAGVVGTATALSLSRAGLAVTLVERDEPGAACSSGNAGLLSVSGCVPIATPGILWSVPRLLLDEEAPLAIRWRYLPKIAPWLFRFLRASAPARVETISIALAGLLAHGHGCYRDLLGKEEFDELTRGGGMLYVYESDRAFEQAHWAHELRRRRGVIMEYVEAERIREVEPALAPGFRHAMLIPETRYTVDPRLLVARLAQHFVTEGGELLRAEVRDLVADPGEPVVIDTTAGVRRADRVVIAAGAWSGGLTAAAGCRVPLDTERGYHAMLPAPGTMPRIPVMSGDHQFAVTPMADGLRFAGTVELAGIDAPSNMARAEVLLRLGRRMFPAVRDAGASFWMGLRPSMPDSMPVIGPVPGNDRVHLAFGHGHLGVTLGAVTGRLVTDMITGRPPLVDPVLFSPARFVRGSGCRGAVASRAGL